METSMMLPELTVALTPRKRYLAVLQVEKRLPSDIFEKLLTAAMEGCVQLYRLLDAAVKKRTTDLFQSLYPSLLDQEEV
jgi:ribonuclease PH